MTLHVAFGCDTFVLLASDRRISMSDGSAVVSDNAGKAVVWRRSAAIGFSGLARLEGQKTNVWIAEVLSRVEREPARALATAAERALAASNTRRVSPRDLSMSFLLIGFTAPHTPTVQLISNHHDESGAQEVAPRRTFHVTEHGIPRGSRHLLMTLGQRPRNAEVAALNERLAGHVRRGAQPYQIARSVVQEMRVIAQNLSSVGHNVLTTMLPEPSLGEPDKVLSISSGRHSLSLGTGNLWTNGALGSTVMVPDMTGPDLPVITWGFDSRPYSSRIASNDEHTKVRCSWPLVAAVSERSEDQFFTAAMGPLAKAILLASAPERLPKLHFGDDPAGPIGTVELVSAEHLRALIRNVPDADGVAFFTDERMPNGKRRVVYYHAASIMATDSILALS